MRIIIVTETRVIADAIHASLRYMGDVRDVVLARRIGEAFIKLSTTTFDACLLDLDLPGATIAMQEVREYWPQMRVVGLGQKDMDGPTESQDYVGKARRQASVKDITEVLIGKSRPGAKPPVPRVPPTGGSDDRPANLSLREAEVAALLAQGLSNKSIARELSIRPGTVKNHVHNVLEKLDVSNRAKVAGRMGMLRWTVV